MRRKHDQSSADPYVPGHGDLSFAARSYDLTLDYSLASNYLSGKAVIKCVITDAADGGQPTQRIEFDLHKLKVDKLAVTGAKVGRWGQEGSRLYVRFAQELAPGTKFTVTVSYKGSPGTMRGIDGDAGWEELTDGVIVASQPHGSPTWFPCNDRASNKATYRFAVTTEAAYTVVANGVLERKRRAGSRMTWIYRADEPMAPYLATLQIGQYETHVLRSAPNLVQVVYPPRIADRVAAAFGVQHHMVDYFSRTFGPYPFAGYTAVVTDDDLEIPLESQTLSTFGANFASTDWQAQRLIAHELAHQWFGNTLTAANWQHIWLHEGFACYSEWLWSQVCGHKSTDRQAHEHWEKLHDLPQNLTLVDPGPEDMFDDRIYKRGALTLHALRVHVGDAAFFELLPAWVERFRFGLVTTDDFIATAEDVTGQPLEEFLRPWLYEKKLPHLPDAAGRVGVAL